MSKKSSKAPTGMATFKVGKDHGRVKVYVRVRPLNSDELSRKENNAVNALVDESKVDLNDSKHGTEKTYHFDHVFPQSFTNAEVSRTISKPIIKSALNGFNGTLMAYGQTGAGKTYTLMGPDGITDTVINTCFARITEDETHAFQVTMSYLQIYQEKIYDLLNSNNKIELILREHPRKGIYVENLTEFVVRNPSEVMNMLSFGRKRLVFAETKMNRHSSRSHSVCVLGIERTSAAEAKKDKDRSSSPKNSIPIPSSAIKEKSKDAAMRPSSAKKSSGKEEHPAHSSARDASNSTIPLGEMQDDEESGISDVASFGDDVKLRGKIYICDLAGSERLKKTHAEGDRLSEAQHINMSLLELGNVIQALAEDRKSHVPFRNSTLTRLLQESLGGNCKTSLIVCVSPAACHVSETKSTLNFGLRAMKVTNNAYVNLEVDYKKLSDELAKMLSRRERDMELVREENDKKVDAVKQEYEQRIKDLIEERNKALDQVREYTEKKERKLLDTVDQLNAQLLNEQEERRRLQREFMYMRGDIEKEIKEQLQAQLNSIFDEERAMQETVEPPKKVEEIEIPKPAPVPETKPEPVTVSQKIPDLVKSVFVSEILSRQLFLAVEKFSGKIKNLMKDNITVEKWLNRIAEMKNSIQNGAYMLLYNLGKYLDIPVDYWIDDFDESLIKPQENLTVDPTSNITDDEKVKLFSKTKGLSEEEKMKEFQYMSQEELNFALRRSKYSIDREAVSLLRSVVSHHDIKGIYDSEEEFSALLDKLLLSMDEAEYGYLDASMKSLQEIEFHQSLCYLFIDKSLQSCIVLLEQALKETRRQDVQVVYSPFLAGRRPKPGLLDPGMDSTTLPELVLPDIDITNIINHDVMSHDTPDVTNMEAKGMEGDAAALQGTGNDKENVPEGVLSPDSGVMSPYTLDRSWDTQSFKSTEGEVVVRNKAREDMESVIADVNELDKQYALIRKDQDQLGELLAQLRERLTSVGEMCAKTSDTKKSSSAPSKRAPTFSERIQQGKQQEKDLRQVHSETKIMEEHINVIESYQSNISTKLAETTDTVEKLKLEKMLKKDENMALRREILALKRERFQLEMDLDKLDDENELFKEIESVVCELLDVEDDIKGLKMNLETKSQEKDSITDCDDTLLTIGNQFKGLKTSLGTESQETNSTNCDNTLVTIGKQFQMFSSGFCGL